jgi:uncharacterized GH25 family protein
MLLNAAQPRTITMKRFTAFKPLLLAAALISASAHAHFVWLEPGAAPGESKAYFGEWADDVRETESGYLKLLTAPRGVAADEKSVSVTRANDHLSLKGPATGDARLVTGYLNDKGVLSLYQPKSGRTETAARHALELVPTAPHSNSFTLLLNGKPLPSKEVVVFGPPKWSKAFHTDKEGRVTITTPWSGQYVVEVGHLDKEAGGQWEGKPYTQTRHVSTLTFQVAP